MENWEETVNINEHLYPCVSVSQSHSTLNTDLKIAQTGFLDVVIVCKIEIAVVEVLY